jgi:two-component system, OmpR family, phosphate regulon sensor histidine kinase PhoR
MGLKARLLLWTSVVLVGILGVSGVLLYRAVARPLVEMEESRLSEDLTTALAVLALRPDLPPAEAVSELDRLLNARFLLVRPDGTVLADSGVPEGNVDGMENHANRPEIQSALEGRSEVLTRPSPTQGVSAVYVAAAVNMPGAVTEGLILRISRPLLPIQAPARQMAGTLLGVGIVGWFVLILLVGGIEGTLNRDLARLRSGVLGVLDGNLAAAPNPEDLAPELEGLAADLQRAGRDLDRRLCSLSQEREELVTLIETMDEGVLLLTSKGQVLRLNRAATELLEVLDPPPLAPIGTLVRHPELREFLGRAGTSAQEVREFTLGARHLQVLAHPLPLPKEGAVVTLIDVTSLRQLEKIRRDFVANASHELKTPLTVVLGFAETLLEGDPPEPLRAQFLSSIRDHTLRLQALVDDLLDLSRLESGSWQAREDKVQIAPLAWRVWKDLRGEQALAGPAFDVQGDAVARADAQALHQILRNLIENAIRFTPPTGSIRVRIEDRGNGVEQRVHISVQDSGAGIPSSALPRIFERFYRVDPGRERGRGGTGLGLAIVRHLVQAMGGDVSAESQLGVGTTIRFTLPRAER